MSRQTPIFLFIFYNVKTSCTSLKPLPVIYSSSSSYYYYSLCDKLLPTLPTLTFTINKGKGQRDVCVGLIMKGVKSKSFLTHVFLNLNVPVVLCVCGTPSLYDPLLIIITVFFPHLCRGVVNAYTASLMFPVMFAIVPGTKNQPVWEYVG